ncbi:MULTISPECIES: class I SAM-dependent methyltransferase [Gracilibacillus]|uniref:class I SAM-dependent methyltransferase n=1 Tax=Gracilibacillus TaxID=74385 RepID=UPI00082544A8|nr:MULTISPECIES: class I SAM-dependent methyltransferase [Gracilibacillus]
MGIDFHNQENRHSYSARGVDDTWINFMRDLIPSSKRNKALDIGCGGGIYCKGLSKLGFKSITGVDYSKTLLKDAIENCKEYNHINFINGNAFNTGLKSNEYDIVLERALIHHVNDLEQLFMEVYRVLKKNGLVFIQDRTPEDCVLKGSNTHIRGYFFSCFPKLSQKEANRRYKSETVKYNLKKVGFKKIEEFKIWEVRKKYQSKQQLLEDLLSRTGRSILHELSDAELKELVHYLDKKIHDNDIIEKDRWTIWLATK